MNTSPAFARIIGIDYSGAETPTASLKGLRVYLAEGEAPPLEVPPPPSSRKYWSRKGIAQWLVERLREGTPTLVGIDHGFSFPLRYFEAHGLLPDWLRFPDDFQRHWPTDEDHTYVEFVRDGIHGNGAARMGNARWRRLTEERAGAAKSVDRWRNPPMQAFHGCASSASASAPACISGPLTAGRSRRGARPSPRSIPPCGRAASPMRAAPATSTTPSALPPGFPAPTATAASLHSSTPIYRRPNARWLRWRAGSLASLTRARAQWWRARSTKRRQRPSSGPC